MVFCILGRVGGISPGVAGVASEHPLEGVAENAARRLQQGEGIPLHIQKGLHFCSPLNVLTRWSEIAVAPCGASQ